MSLSSLDHFIVQVRACMDRGLVVHADDVLDGLQHAIDNKRDKDAVPFDQGVNYIEDRIRHRLEMKRSRRQEAEAAQQLPLQLHDLDYTYRGPPKIST